MTLCCRHPATVPSLSRAFLGADLPCRYPWCVWGILDIILFKLGHVSSYSQGPNTTCSFRIAMRISTAPPLDCLYLPYIYRSLHAAIGKCNALPRLDSGRLLSNCGAPTFEKSTTRSGGCSSSMKQGLRYWLVLCTYVPGWVIDGAQMLDAFQGRPALVVSYFRR